MATIIAGEFATIAETENAQADLQAAGIGPDKISVFVLNPPGQHALYPIGGDEDADRGATDAHTGAVSGALIGASAGLGIGAAAIAATAAAPAAAVAVAVAATGAGAYGGSLIGTLNKLGDAAEGSAPTTAETRHAGVMVAVNVENTAALARAIGILQAHGAKQIERAEGEWRDGEWLDFDPRISPELVYRSAAA